MRDKANNVFALQNLKIRVVESSGDNWLFDLRSPLTSTHILSQDSLMWIFRLMYIFYSMMIQLKRPKTPDCWRLEPLMKCSNVIILL